MGAPIGNCNAGIGKTCTPASGSQGGMPSAKAVRVRTGSSYNKPYSQLTRKEKAAEAKQEAEYFDKKAGAQTNVPKVNTSGGNKNQSKPRKGIDLDIHGNTARRKGRPGIDLDIHGNTAKWRD